MFISSCFFFNDTATTEIYTLSLHDALPILQRELALLGLGELRERLGRAAVGRAGEDAVVALADAYRAYARERPRSEEHTSELQSRQYLVCRLLLEKKYNNQLLNDIIVNVNI